MKKISQHIFSIIIAIIFISIIGLLMLKTNGYNENKKYFDKAQKIYEQFILRNKDNDKISSNLFIKVENDVYVIYDSKIMITELYTLEEVKEYYQVKDLQETVYDNDRTIVYTNDKEVEIAFYNQVNDEEVTMVYSSENAEVEFRVANRFLEWKYKFEDNDLWKRVAGLGEIYRYQM